MKRILVLLLICTAVLAGCTSQETTFAVIGDYGLRSQPEAEVAQLVHSWAPEFIITTGDNCYECHSVSDYEKNVGAFYGEDIEKNRFFPTLGNHDWDAGTAYFDYFSLPGNERYYDLIKGNVHLFFVDSDSREPDGILEDSKQAYWLKEKLADSKEKFNIVIFHHPPQSSAKHAGEGGLQWPVASWGADLVLMGHDHVYERFMYDGIPYIITGAGGKDLYAFSTEQKSIVRYNKDFGAILIQSTNEELDLMYITRNGALIDSILLT